MIQADAEKIWDTDIALSLSGIFNYIHVGMNSVKPCDFSLQILFPFFSYCIFYQFQNKI